MFLQRLSKFFWVLNRQKTPSTNFLIFLFFVGSLLFFSCQGQGPAKDSKKSGQKQIKWASGIRKEAWIFWDLDRWKTFGPLFVPTFVFWPDVLKWMEERREKWKKNRRQSSINRRRYHNSPKSRGPNKLIDLTLSSDNFLFTSPLSLSSWCRDQTRIYRYRKEDTITITRHSKIHRTFSTCDSQFRQLVISL